MQYDDLKRIKSAIDSLHRSFTRMHIDVSGNICLQINNGSVLLNKEYLLAEFQQILETQTLERTRYYLRRLIKSLTISRTGKLNDINLNRWKEYNDVITDSLWLLDKRDRSGMHSAKYWGNFVPQIPNQLLRRFTKPGEWVLDPFLGSGTTLLECKHLGRNGIGIELQIKIAKATRNAIAHEQSKHSVRCEVVRGDSTRLDFSKQLKQFNMPSVQFALVHPPYWDIIKFSKHNHDLSNAKSLQKFLDQFGCVIKNCAAVLDNERYLAVVIGDKYSEREWIPLGFLSMQEVLKHGFKLKSIIVKNFNQTKAKRSQEELWRYRALLSGFYVFKHEYIFLFQKK